MGMGLYYPNQVIKNAKTKEQIDDKIERESKLEIKLLTQSRGSIFSGLEKTRTILIYLDGPAFLIFRFH